MSKTLRPWTIYEFEEKTPLIPAIVGQTIALRAGMSTKNAYTFAMYVERRMMAVFNHNKAFRRKMLGQCSREWLYVFAEHWFISWRAELERRPKHTDVDELFK